MLLIDEDIRFMERAIALAEAGQLTARPNPKVGCVIVREGQIIGEGAHLQAGMPHAERVALASVQGEVQGAICYVTLEPCAHEGRTAPCVEALINAGVSRVVIAMRDPNPRVNGQGIAQLRAQGIEVTEGVLSEAAASLNPGFISRMTRHRPYVRAKLALSLDGRVAMASGESQWITGSVARERVQQLRAQSGAILTGSNTVLKDNPRLTVRSEAVLSTIPSEVNFMPPLRVVLDRQARIPQTAAIFSEEAPTWHVTGGQSLENTLEALAEREINDVLVEAGPTLVGALLQNNLIDELILFYAPKLLGSQAMPMAHLPNLTSLSEHIGFYVKSLEQIGEDICLTVVKNAEVHEEYQNV